MKHAVATLMFAACLPALAGGSTRSMLEDDLVLMQQARDLVAQQLPAGTDSGAAGRVESLLHVAPYRFSGTAANQRAIAWALEALHDAGLQNVHAEPVWVPHWVRGCASRALLAASSNARAGKPGPEEIKAAAVSPGMAPPLCSDEACASRALLAASSNARAGTTPAECPDGDVLAEITGEQPQRLTATALGGSAATPRSGITAPVLMLGSLDELKTRPLSEIKNRIVFFNPRMPRRADGSGYGETVGVRTRGAAEAGRRGALAVVIRSVGTNHDDVPHTGSLRYDEIVPRIPAAALSDVDADLLEQRVSRCADMNQPVLLHLRVDTQNLGLTRSANVIGEIPGSTDEIVLLAAHLDSWDITPGANDDGAGVAILLSAMRLLAQSGQRPRRTLRLLLTANEEFGVSGAKAYAKAHAAEIGRHVLAMEADFGSGPVQVLNAGVRPADWPRVQKMAEALQALGVAEGGNGRSGGADVNPLFERGVPVLAPRQDGSAYFDIHHTTQDTPDKLDLAGLEQNVKVYASLAWMAANASAAFERLRVTAGDP